MPAPYFSLGFMARKCGETQGFGPVTVCVFFGIPISLYVPVLIWLTVSVSLCGNMGTVSASLCNNMGYSICIILPNGLSKLRDPTESIPPSAFG